MERIIANKVKGMNWMAKISLILVFTLIFSTFMHQGWYRPKAVQAAVAFGNAGGVATGTTSLLVPYPLSIAAGNLLVLAISNKYPTNGPSTPAGWTLVVNGQGSGGAGAAFPDSGNVYSTVFVREAVGTESGDVTVTITGGNSAQGMILLYTKAAGTTWSYAATNGSDNTSDTAWSVTGAANPGITVGDMLVVVSAANQNGNSTYSGETVTATSATIAAGNERQDVGTNQGDDSYLVVSDHSVTAGTATAAPVFTMTGTGASAGASSILRIREVAPSGNLTIGEGTNPGVANAPQSSTNNALDGFTLQLSAGSGTVSTLTVTGSPNFTATNIPTNGVKVYRDLGTVGAYNAGTDVLVSSASTAIAGNATTVTISSEGVTTSAVNYLVTVDINAGATLTQSFTANISGATGTGLGTITDSDASSATLTVTAALPKTTITSCADCHGYPPVDGATRDGATGRFPGSHDTHAGSGAGQYGFVCTNCHISPLWTSFNHRDGNVQFTTLFGGVAGGSYSRTNASNWFTQVNTVSPGTCANTYCHSKGTGGTLNPGETRPVATPNTSPTWGSVVTCVSCHGNETGNPGNGAPWYTTQTTKANSHQAHAGAGNPCFKCHNATTTDGTTITSVGRHNNRTYDIVAGPGISIGSYTYSTTGGTCATVSCHGGGSPKWGTGAWDCTGCHAGPITKTLGGGGTIRQVTGATGDFSRASRHLFNAGFNSILKWDCIVCHMEGNQADANGKTNPTYHNEGAGATGGMVNVRNVDVPATGWAINNRTWTTTDYTNLDTFCLTCHDADGAAGINVNATNNGLNLAATRALTPFNTSNYPGGVVGASTTSPNAGPRTRVINIKDKFFAGSAGSGAAYNGNPSQHAVIGQRYSTVNANWTAAAWGSYIGKKMGQNVNVRRETSLLSCADCHVLDAGSGAHGGTNPYNMLNAAVNVTCQRCHNSAVYTAGGAGSRMDHSNIGNGQENGNTTTYGLSSNENCLLCHASWNPTSTVTRNASYGGIHGSWSSTATYTAGTARTAYRFAPGAWMRMSPPSDTAWGSGGTGSCYFNTDPTDGWSNCSSHDGGNVPFNSAYNFGRPPKY